MALLSKIKSTGLIGIEGYIVDVEVDISNGLPQFDIVGLPDTAVKESKERVRAAIKNSGLEFPIKRITVNLAPADTRKEGSIYDLSIAIGILLATGQIPYTKFCNGIFIGELSLDGSIKSVDGVLPMLLSVSKPGIDVVVAKQNVVEAMNVDGINVYSASTLSSLVEDLKNARLKPADVASDKDLEGYIDNFAYDFSDIKGQDSAKRALEVSAAGSHNIILIGQPGVGKTMMAKCLPSILPGISYKEAIEITQIYSAAGLLKGEGLIKRRPFRCPHHTISATALAGGGRIPKPGEISLAHNGVLFLDELPEFSREALEILRQPLEDGAITISRIYGTVMFPAKFMLVASMNPTPCGYYPWQDRCHCTPNQVSRYIDKISGALFDRFDIQIEMAPISFDKLSSTNTSQSSKKIKQRVDTARMLQLYRYKDEGIVSNAQLNHRQISKYCIMHESQKKLLKDAFERLNLSARAYDRILRVARTIADLDGEEYLQDNHIAEAIQYRSLDRNYLDRIY